MLRHSSTTKHYYWLGLTALAVALFALVHPLAPATSPPAASLAQDASSMAASGPLDGDLNNEGQDDGMANSLAASSGRSVRGQLDNDLDNEGNPDGMSDPLVVLVLGSILVPAVGSSLFLLSLYELPMVGYDCCPTLERPG